MSEKKPNFVREIPEGEDRERLVCADCGHIQYDNPKIVVGAVVTWKDEILLCKRAIEPRTGYWTLPAGFMELGETVQEGAAREAWEEAYAKIRVGPVLALYSIPHISQVQIFFTAELESPDVSAGPESQEVGLFTWDEIPWKQLAFPSVHWALRQWRGLDGATAAPAFVDPPEGAPHRLMGMPSAKDAEE